MRKFSWPRRQDRGHRSLFFFRGRFPAQGHTSNCPHLLGSQAAEAGTLFPINRAVDADGVHIVSEAGRCSGKADQCQSKRGIRFWEERHSRRAHVRPFNFRISTIQCCNFVCQRLSRRRCPSIDFTESGGSQGRTIGRNLLRGMGFYESFQ